MKLRKWQHECVEQALIKYKKDSHFFCLATPGAGKTIMAAELAFRMIEEDLIDLVLCFSPSTAVMQGIEETFAQRFNSRFDGLIGAKGASYTYQSMSYLSNDFWDLLKLHRVLVVFDEIHHCAGNDLYNCNAWGEKILAEIQGKAKYTLAMSGTPWRTDCLPLVLASYSDSSYKVQCDYEYGLLEAIKSEVCRSPNIVLIDNDECSIIDANKGKVTFSGFEELFKNKRVAYRSILNDKDAVDYMLKSANKKLMEIRKDQKNAAGLIVAYTIDHAKFICNRIIKNLGVKATLVNYLMPNSQDIINQFRNSKDHWVVSIGMISEGTDIPRLQVCCHLSHIKTEMYYRQILGRILRKTTKNAENAWLFTFAEKSLVQYANRIVIDIPEYSSIENLQINRKISTPNLGFQIESNVEENELKEVLPLKNFSTSKFSCNENPKNKDISFTLSKKYKESILNIFNSPF